MTNQEPCRWCGDTTHGVRCPLVKALEFDNTGLRVTRVEFFSAADHYSPALLSSFVQYPPGYQNQPTTNPFPQTTWGETVPSHEGSFIGRGVKQ